MKPRGSWYFEGYRRQERPNPRGTGTKQVLVYVGEYYGFPGGKPEQNRVKCRTTLAMLVTFLAYFYAQFTPAEGGMNRFVALPGILMLVPILFLLIGQGNFLVAKEKWEIRVLYAGYRRVKGWGIGYLVLTILWIAAELVFVAMNLSLFLTELHYLLGALVALAGAIWLVYEVRTHPAVVVQGPKVE